MCYRYGDALQRSRKMAQAARVHVQVVCVRARPRAHVCARTHAGVYRDVVRYACIHSRRLHNKDLCLCVCARPLRIPLGTKSKETKIRHLQQRIAQLEAREAERACYLETLRHDHMQEVVMFEKVHACLR